MQTEQITKMANKALKAMGNVLHNAQRERGMACLYLDSTGKLYANRYQTQLAHTDEAVEKFNRIASDASLLNALPEFTEARLSDIRAQLAKLEAIRKSVLDRSVRYTQVINDYTFTINLPILDGMVEYAHRTPGFNTALISAYANLLQWKEMLGRERALTSRGFYSDAFKNIEFCDRMLSLIAEQESYLTLFKSMASPAQIEIVKPAIDNEDMKAIEALHKNLKQNENADEIDKYTVETWFDLMTRSIDRLHEAEKHIVDELTGKKGTETPLTALTEKKDIGEASEYESFVRDMPLFSGLSDHDLRELLSFAQVRPYRRGHLLFLQGEPASRMYIILKGWVKVFNGTEAGDETILQMLCAGDTLLEAAVFLNAATPMSAQVVEDAILLSFPSPIIRKRVQQNNELAMSMLNNVSLRSQRLIHQMEQSRLKSARERVGWFLLRLYISQDNTDGTLYLPYDKSIIASYLNMRPETFSRTLKKLKAEGIEIKQDKITLPGPKSLCQYCDSYLAEDCVRAGTDDCPNPDIEIFDHRMPA